MAISSAIINMESVKGVTRSLTVMVVREAAATSTSSNTHIRTIKETVEAISVPVRAIMATKGISTRTPNKQSSVA